MSHFLFFWKHDEHIRRINESIMPSAGCGKMNKAERISMLQEQMGMPKSNKYSQILKFPKLDLTWTKFDLNFHFLDKRHHFTGHVWPNLPTFS